jgi:hypothetical protein
LPALLSTCPKVSLSRLKSKMEDLPCFEPEKIVMQMVVVFLSDPEPAPALASDGLDEEATACCDVDCGS